MLAKKASKKTCIEIVAASRTGWDQETDLLTTIKVSDRLRRGATRDTKDKTKCNKE
jgi:hypothetical protein